MEKRDPEADNHESTGDADAETDQPVDGPGGAEGGSGATSQDEPG